MANGKIDAGPVLVLGGNGKTGRRLADRLAAAGRPVRLGSRAGAPRFDWEDEASWAPALGGMGAVYIAYQPDLAAPGAAETVRAFLAHAAGNGIRRIVLLSGRGEPEAREAEEALEATGVDWTILRSSWFCQNFSESFFLDPIVAGDVALPVAAVAEPFVDVEDIADIAFAALTETRHAGQLYEITGPRAVTFPEAIAEIAAAAGRDIRYRTVPADAYRAALAADIPDGIIDLILYLFTTVLDGRNTPVADGVERALGRSPRDFSSYVRLTAATGIWGG